jgi:hypothetical protein
MAKTNKNALKWSGRMVLFVGGEITGSRLLFEHNPDVTRTPQMLDALHTPFLIMIGYWRSRSAREREKEKNSKINALLVMIFHIGFPPNKELTSCQILR